MSSRGRPFGYMVTDEQRDKIAATQKLRWSDPERRALAVAGCVAAWSVGARAKDRVRWTPEMDAALIQLRATTRFKVFREQAPKLLGVSDNLVLQRARVLNLAQSRFSSKISPVRTAPVVVEKPKSSTPVVLPPGPLTPLRIAQLAADEYARKLLLE